MSLKKLVSVEVKSEHAYAQFIEDSVAKSLAPKKGTIKTSAGFMLVDQEEATANVEIIEKCKKGRKKHCPTNCLNP